MDMMLILLYAFPVAIVGGGLLIVLRAKAHGYTEPTNTVMSSGGHQPNEFSLEHSTFQPLTNTNGIAMVPGTGIDVCGNPYGS